MLCDATFVQCPCSILCDNATLISACIGLLLLLLLLLKMVIIISVRNHCTCSSSLSLHYSSRSPTRYFTDTLKVFFAHSSLSVVSHNLSPEASFKNCNSSTRKLYIGHSFIALLCNYHYSVITLLVRKLF